MELLSVLHVNHVDRMAQGRQRTVGNLHGSWICVNNVEAVKDFAFVVSTTKDLDGEGYERPQTIRRSLDFRGYYLSVIPVGWYWFHCLSGFDCICVEV
jgi:hypothetical protein